MIITIDGIEFGGDILKADNEQLQLMIRTEMAYEVLVGKLTNVKKIVCTETIHGTSTEYTGIKPVSMSTITNGVYMVTLSLKAGRYDTLKAEVDSLNDAVDDLLVMLLGE